MRQVTLKKQGGWAWLAWAIPAAAKLLEGVMGQQGQKQQNELTQQQIDMQKDFALHGVQYRVDDAARAGVSPLAALGGNLVSPSPVSVMGDSNPMGRALGDMGQNIGSYLASQQTDAQKAAQALDLELKGRELETQGALADMYRSQAALNRQRATQDAGQGVGGVVQVGSTGKPVPSSTGPLDWVELKPPEQDIRASDDSSRTAGVNPFWSKVEIAPGQFMWVPSERINQMIQDMPMWAQGAMGMKNFGERYMSAMRSKKRAEARGEWWNQRAGRAIKDWLNRNGISW